MFLYIIGGLASFFVVLLIQRRLASKPRDERLTFNGYPSRAGSLLGIALNILLKRQGRLYPGFKDVPKIEIIIENAEYVAFSHSKRAPKNFLLLRLNFLWFIFRGPIFHYSNTAWVELLFS
jgi:hypothetical protein